MRFKDYANETLNTLPYGLADQLITAYNPYNINDFCKSGEAVLDGLAHSYLGDVSANESSIIRVLLYLNRKIEATRKTISFWDAYQIRDTIQDRDQALGQLAQLPANSSVVSNLRDPFVWVNNQGESETIYQGDILIKDYDERLHHIKTSSSGFYVPFITSSSANNFTINYTFNTVQQPVAPISIEYTGNNPGYYSRGSIAAGDDYVDLDLLIVPTGTGSADLLPAVKYYTVSSNAEYEQVIIDRSFGYEIIDDRECFVLRNPTCITLWYEVK